MIFQANSHMCIKINNWFNPLNTIINTKWNVLKDSVKYAVSELHCYETHGEKSEDTRVACEFPLLILTKLRDFIAPNLPSLLENTS